MYLRLVWWIIMIFAATRMSSMGNVLGSGAVMTKLSLINDNDKKTHMINIYLQTVEFKIQWENYNSNYFDLLKRKLSVHHKRKRKFEL